MALALVLALFPVLTTPQASNDGEPEAERWLARYCGTCHGLASPEADLTLVPFVPDDRFPFALAAERLRAGEMPPRGAEAPTVSQRAELVGWLEKGRDAQSANSYTPPAPLPRRLSRFEYENSVRDLTGLPFDARTLFPPDDVAGGFDNGADSLTFSEVLLEKYFLAAEDVAARALPYLAPGTPRIRRLEGSELSGGAPVQETRVLATNGNVSARWTVLSAGPQRVTVEAFARQAGPAAAHMRLHVDASVVGEFEVRAVREAPERYGATVELAVGEHEVRAEFTNDYFRPEAADPEDRDRNLHILGFEVEAPEPAPTPLAATLLDPARPRRERLAWIAGRAYRRPATPTELGEFESFFEAGQPEALAFRSVLAALLTSPAFLLRTEGPREPGREHAYPVDSHSLATRLSYFLWSTLPDEPLTRLAQRAELTDPAVLRAVTEHMLADPRASALATNFAPQWLQLRRLEDRVPDPRRLERFDDELRLAMMAETERLFEAVLFERRPIRTLLDARFTFLNERLARHYGLPDVEGPFLRRVPVRDPSRQGLLGHASVLTATSNPDATSPVLRGKWILESLLGTPPPPPPPGVGSLEEALAHDRTLSPRQQLERHREQAECAACHARMDPLGFGLENFDGFGAWRTELDGRPVDARGTLPDGRSFEGPAALRGLLQEDPRFPRTLLSNLFVYALGRPPRQEDRRLLERLVEGLPESPTLHDLIHALVQSDAFRLRPGSEKESV